jgi:hypothetical protein
MRIISDGSLHLQQEQMRPSEICPRGVAVSIFRWAVVIYLTLMLPVSIVVLYMIGATPEEYLVIGLILVIPSAAVFACNPRARRRRAS